MVLTGRTQQQRLCALRGLRERLQSTVFGALVAHGVAQHHGNQLPHDDAGLAVQRHLREPVPAEHKQSHTIVVTERAAAPAAILYATKWQPTATVQVQPLADVSVYRRQ